MIYITAVALFLVLLLLLYVRSRNRTLTASLPKRQSWTAEGVHQESWHAGAAQSNISIPMTGTMLAAAEAAQQEQFALLEQRMIACGVFVPETIPTLIAVLRAVSQPFSRVDTSAAFEGERVLTVTEERTLNLNTRMKYTAEYIAFFRPEALTSIEPKQFLSDMHLSVFNEVQNRRELADLRASGLIQKVGRRAGLLALP